MNEDAKFLLSLLDGASIPGHHEEWCDVVFDLKDGWKVTIFYDCGELDYIENFIRPDGTIVNFWEWDDDSEGRSELINWRG